ncbi:MULTISPECIES: VOC family protein [unclassified Streptomyces]|uniref:VOC family protein n=1 Tax=unclassified Streptomyces TaxID=2593676 RepID=UPI002E2AE8A7|nr:VOC family protein [Streptomyces sp. NBC_00441]
MPALAQLKGVTLDCPDPVALAEFYHRFAGFEISFSTAEFAGLTVPDGPGIGFQRVADYRRPDWPGQSVPQQLHLDFAVDDVTAAEKKAVELGASVPAEQPGGERWRVLLDPAGHSFCLSATN